SLLGIELLDEELDTIGGWVYTQNPGLKKGSEWTYGPLQFTVREKDRHRIRKLEIVKLKAMVSGHED
ncbi:MAG: transporter associated domain-containing protein, partial [Paenibacillus macerans]|nr:transporter associated domain-containing protein [Paenibacillus macerans]